MTTQPGPWFELFVDIPRSPMTLALAVELNRSVPPTVGHLVCLWDVANERRPSGDLTSLSDLEIEDWAQWQGPPGHFVAALERVGYLCRMETETILCDQRGRPHPSIYPKPMKREKQEKGEY